MEKAMDYGLAITKGLVASLIPWFGSMTVELLNVTIPNKKIKRIQALLTILQTRIFEIEEELLQKRFNDDDFTDFYEKVLRQAVETKGQRLEYLASVLETCIRNENFDYLQNKILLEIFSKINDIEVIILQSYALIDSKQQFKELHIDIFSAEKLAPIAHALNQDERKQWEMLNYSKNHLIALELIGEFHLHNDNFLITYLGGELLKLIGLKIESAHFGKPLNALEVSRNLVEKIEENNFNQPPASTPFFRRNLGRG